METVVTPHLLRQKGDNFGATMDRVLIGSFRITAGSQYLMAQVGGKARKMDCEQALYFALPLVSRLTPVSCSARNIAFAPLDS